MVNKKKKYNGDPVFKRYINSFGRLPKKKNSFGIFYRYSRDFKSNINNL